MNIGIITQGSNGDIEMMIPLALELAKRNHKVEMLIVTINHRDYAYLNSYRNISIHQIHVHKELKCDNTDFEFWKYEDGTKTILDKFNAKVEVEIIDFSQKISKEKDLVIGAYHVTFLASLAEKYEKPYVSVNYPLEYIRTRYEAPMKLANITETGDIDKLWDLWDSYCNKIKRPINRFRKQQGMHAIRNVRQDIFESKFLNLLPYSTVIAKRKPDWKDTFQVSGFIRSEKNSNNWELPSKLKNFLSEKHKPVLITVGSMEIHENNLHDFQNLLIATAKNIARKVIILSNWDEPDTIDKNVYKLKGFVSYPTLFKECALVVHHGGIGIIHHSLEVGCPSIIVKYGLDQPYNAKILYDMGVSGGSIFRKDLTSGKLELLIKTTLDNNKLFSNALNVSKQLNNEVAGNKTAVDIIESRMVNYITNKRECE